MTFVGFKIDEEGHLVNPITNKIEQENIISRYLYCGLTAQGVDLSQNYHSWSKEDMLIKICSVMGFTFEKDPDESYVLTSDNMIKILAIQMRFRYFQ